MRYITFLFLALCFNVNAQFQRSTDGAIQTANNINYWQQDGSNNLSYSLGTEVMYTNNTFASRLGIRGNNTPFLLCQNNAAFTDFNTSTLRLSLGSGISGPNERAWIIQNNYLTSGGHLMFGYWNGSGFNHAGSWWADGNLTIGGADNLFWNTGEKFQVKGTSRFGESGMAQTTSIFRTQSAGGIRNFYNVFTSPETIVSASPGDISFGETGTMWQKLTGTGNTGWGQFFNLGLSHDATNGQVMKYNGTVWAPANDLNTTYTGGTGIDITGTVISNIGTASTTPNTPAGNIASTTVQTALNELDSEKNVNIQFQEDGTNLGTPGNVSVVNFVGSNVTATRAGNTVNVTVTGGSGGTPGGTNTQLQFNNSGSFGGAAVTWSTTDTLLSLQNSRFRVGTTARLFQGLYPVPAGIVYNSTNRAGLVITDNVAEGVRPTSLMLSGNLNSTNRSSLMYLQPTGTALAPGKTTGAGFNIIGIGNAYYAQPSTVTSGTITAASLGHYTNQYWQNTGASLAANGEYTNYGSSGQIATTGVTVGTFSDFRTENIAGSTNGVITNRYNLHITSTQSTVGGQGVANNWGVFQTDLNSKNAFGGRTMFGAITNPLATVHIRGINAIGDSTSFLVENSAGTSSAWASNNGTFNIGSRTGNRWSLNAGGASFTNGVSIANLTVTAGNIDFPFSYLSVAGGIGIGGSWSANANNAAFDIARTFTQSANSNIFVSADIRSTINQTGTANGAIYGIRYRPTLTSILGQHYAATFLTGNVGIGTEAPSSRFTNTTNAYFGGNAVATAYVHLAPGTTSTAPLRFTQTGAALLTTPVAGSVEADNNRLYYTDSGNTRRTIAHLNDITPTTAAPFSLTGTANGLTVTSGAINLNAATFTTPGAVSTELQIFGGPKVFRTDANIGTTNILMRNDLIDQDGEYISMSVQNGASSVMGEDSYKIKGGSGAANTAKETFVKADNSLVAMQVINGQTKTTETYGWKLDGVTNLLENATLNAATISNRDGVYLFSGQNSILELPAPNTLPVGTTFEWVVGFTTGTQSIIRNVGGGAGNNFITLGTSAATSSVTLPLGRSAGKVTVMTFGGTAYWLVRTFN